MSQNEAIRVLQLEGQAILDCAKRLSEGHSSQGFARAIELLEKSLAQGGKIVVTGIGKSGKVAQKISATLSSTGSLSVYLHPTEGLHGDLGLVESKDCVLALSHTGNTDELLRLIPSLKAIGTPIIAISGNASSQLVEQATAWIDSRVEQEACPHNLAPTTSTTLALALGDALAMSLMRLRGFDAEHFAQNHPGGAIGKRLHLKVSDVMHSGDQIATCGPDATMDEVVVASTKKKLGIVLITEGKKLLGVVTDGDIRRALQHRERFFSMKASEIMTRKPATISADMMAKAAIDLMENRPSQISALPVVNSQGEWLGVVRLHDLVRTL